MEVRLCQQERLGRVRSMLAVDLAQRWYRTSDTAGLRQLLLRYGKPLVSLRSVDHDGQQTLKQVFDLPPKASWTVFATYRHVLIACLKSQPPRPKGSPCVGRSRAGR
jgi:hypothetical protein